MRNDTYFGDNNDTDNIEADVYNETSREKENYLGGEFRKTMRKRTGKVWTRSAANIYKNVFHVCPLTNFSRGNGSDDENTTFQTNIFLNSTCPFCPYNLRK